MELVCLGEVVAGEIVRERLCVQRQTDFAVYVIINYGDLGNKLNEIRAIRQRRLDNGERASEIVVIDAKPKASASKRK